MRNGIFSSEAITLGSIQIFSAHEWLATKPTVYFLCQGEDKIILPDVKEKDFLYTFKGEESWQPLAELADNKCKRCGFYEMDNVKSDDVFDEWEFCRDDFVDGSYVHFKDKEFNATFTCSACKLPAIIKKKLNVALAVLIAVLTCAMVIAAIVGIHKYWKKRKRERDQARFLKLFEDNDEEDELDQL